MAKEPVILGSMRAESARSSTARASLSQSGARICAIDNGGGIGITNHKDIELSVTANQEH